MIWVKTTLIVLLLLLSLSWSCASSSAPKDNDSKRTVTDGLGRSVSIPSRLTRAVSLAPSITEMIFSAGAGNRLIGVTTYCNYPPEALAIRKVGDTQTPNIESIIALQPEVVFVSTDSQLQSFASVLQEQNVAIYVLDIKQFNDVPRLLRELGTIFGTESTAEAAAADLERRVGGIERRVRGPSPVRVFLQISREPFFTIGRDSFLTEVIERAGGLSVTKDVPSAYPKLNKETALALKPDAIILSDSEDNPSPNDVFKDSPAMKDGRVYRINADVISRPGPRMVEATELIAGFLHDETLQSK